VHRSRELRGELRVYLLQNLQQDEDLSTSIYGWLSRGPWPRIRYHADMSVKNRAHPP
jgi:hypothetical protein